MATRPAPAKRRFKRLTLTVRATDCPCLDIFEAGKATAFDGGWTAYNKGDPLKANASPVHAAGWFAAQSAWSARHNAITGVLA